MFPSLLTDRLPGRVRTGMALPGDYRTLPRVSNSDLTRLKEEQLGSYDDQPSALWVPERSQLVGKAFHQHLIEPTSVGSVLDQLLPDLATTRAEPIMDIVQQDSFCRRYLRLADRCAAGQAGAGRAERDRVVLFTDPATQLPCKARLDLVYISPKRQQGLILDFKPTSARTQAQFLQSCYDYDYDRQAAFYLDSLRHADSGEWDATSQIRFVFVGVVNEEPGRLFAVEATSLPGFVEYGRKKYRFWLKKWQETNGLLD